VEKPAKEPKVHAESSGLKPLSEPQKKKANKAFETASKALAQSRASSNRLVDEEGLSDFVPVKVRGIIYAMCRDPFPMHSLPFPL
jgi:hypothetical protein